MKAPIRNIVFSLACWLVLALVVGVGARSDGQLVAEDGPTNLDVREVERAGAPGQWWLSVSTRPDFDLESLEGSSLSITP